MPLVQFSLKPLQFMQISRQLPSMYEPDLFVPQAKLLRVLTLAIKMYHHQYTPKQAAEVLGTSERTAYRYFNLLDAAGIPVDSIDSHYFIAQDDCPFCHRVIKEDGRDIASPTSSVPGDSLILTYGQACQLQHMNLERRLKRDLDQALSIAHSHITGDWGSYTTARVPEEQISIVFYNDNERLENGQPIVECLVQGYRQG